MYKTFLPRILIAALFLFQFSFAHSQDLTYVIPEEVNVSSERLEYLSNTFEEYVNQEKLPGAVIMLLKDGKVFYHESFGKKNIAANKDMEGDDIFRIASQTKAIVSAGIMILQEEGKLLIHDAVGKYIPEYNKTTVAEASTDGQYNIVDAKRKITIRDLLTHTAGIGYGYGVAKDLWEKAGIQGWYFADRKEPILETVKRMASLPMDAHPGEKFVYGYNTDILGAVIEVVSGQSLDEFLSEKILHPLGMKDSHFYLPKSKAHRLTTVYSLTDNGLIESPNPGQMNGQGMYVEGPRMSYSGGAGLLSTAHDYAVFLQMMLNGGSYNHQRILSRKSVELMTVDHLDGIEYHSRKGSGFGLGFSVVKDLGRFGKPASVGEFTWGGAYHSTYWADPQENMVVVYFTQVRPARGLDDHDKLRTLVYQALK
ncbi:serine hydrolase domain-containing protein [Membranihabitans marinus]|uniref:serine hydrolase domain-containing protein n=1 Tax=Membranihabitans marinus TaxID=1227546 RepID=UPI001F2188A7|nr:serine hydrolase domain-containing protein [Membranihabitans marinus]